MTDSVALDSVDEFVGAIASFGWSTDFRQIHAGRERVDARLLGTPRMTLIEVTFANAVLQRGLPPAGFTTIGIPTGPQAPGRIGRRPLESETLSCFDARNGMDAVSPAGFSAYSISIENEWLAEAGCCLAGEGLPEVLAMQGVQKAPEPLTMAGLRKALRNYIGAALHAGLSPGQWDNLIRDMEEEVPALLLSAWLTSPDISYVKASNRSRALKLALAYLEARADDVVTVKDLCRESGSSLSTLERAFKEQFGVSPKRFLISTRLARARRALCNPVDSRNITDIATASGYWHMSKFSADYQRMYGELPSVSRQARHSRIRAAS